MVGRPGTHMTSGWVLVALVAWICTPVPLGAQGSDPIPGPGSAQDSSTVEDHASVEVLLGLRWSRGELRGPGASLQATAGKSRSLSLQILAYPGLFHLDEGPSGFRGRKDRSLAVRLKGGVGARGGIFAFVERAEGVTLGRVTGPWSSSRENRFSLRAVGVGRKGATGRISASSEIALGRKRFRRRGGRTSRGGGGGSTVPALKARCRGVKPATP